MANRQCLKSITRPLLYQNLKTPLPAALSNIIQPLHNNPNPTSYLHQFLQHPTSNQLISSLRNFSSSSSSSRRNIRPGDKLEQGEEEEEQDYDEDDVDEEDDSEEEEDDEMSEYSDEEDDDSEVGVRPVGSKRAYTVEEKAHEAAGIGYKVTGPLDPKERPFKHREPYFAVVQIGSHQFKVSNGDVIYTEKLKYCEVNDKLILTKVLMVGSASQTIIGRPILPEAAVHAVVEEHALDAKVIIFKKKRRKNYRRTKGHRQELTRLRITDIQGIEKPEKPEKVEKVKVEKVKVEKSEDVAVAA